MIVDKQNFPILSVAQTDYFWPAEKGGFSDIVCEYLRGDLVPIMKITKSRWFVAENYIKKVAVGWVSQFVDHSVVLRFSARLKIEQAGEVLLFVSTMSAE